MSSPENAPLEATLRAHIDRPFSPTKLLGLSLRRGESPEELVLWKTFQGHEFFVKREHPDAPCWDWIILDATSNPVEFGEGVTFEAAEAALAQAAYKLFTTDETPAPPHVYQPAPNLFSTSTGKLPEAEAPVPELSGSIPVDRPHCHACMALAALERLCR